MNPTFTANRRKGRSLYFSALTVAGWLMLGAMACPDEPTARDYVKETQKLTDAQAANYKMTLAKGDVPLTLLKKRVLSWSNPARGEIYGNVYLWTLNGQPQVVGSLYQWYSPHTHSSCELQSLSQVNLNSTCDHHLPWHPKIPGVEFTSVQNAPAPAKTPTRRLLQMRQIVRQLRARKTDREGVETELRLLTQPVYRYGSEDSEIVDGALFTFVQGTDPEVWLLIEATSKDDRLAWRIAFARMNSLKFVVKRKRETIWEVDVLPWGTVKNRDQPYTSYRSVDPNDTGKPIN